MEKPLVRTLLILAGAVTFSISAWSSAPACYLSAHSNDHQAMCLAKAQLDVSRCTQIRDGDLQLQCQISVNAAN